MKKIQIVLITLITTTLFISCQNSKGVSKPDDIGKHALTILKKLDNMTKEEYMSSLFTVEEIKAFGERNAETLTPKAKEGIDKIEKERHEERVKKDYDRLKESAKKNNISWSAIEYDNYEFEERDQDGIKFVRGNLSFKHNDEIYGIGMTSVLVDGTYMLIRTSRLRKKKE